MFPDYRRKQAVLPDQSETLSSVQTVFPFSRTVFPDPGSLSEETPDYRNSYRLPHRDYLSSLSGNLFLLFLFPCGLLPDILSASLPALLSFLSDGSAVLYCLFSISLSAQKHLLFHRSDFPGLYNDPDSPFLSVWKVSAVESSQVLWLHSLHLFAPVQAVEAVLLSLPEVSLFWPLHLLLYESFPEAGSLYPVFHHFLLSAYSGLSIYLCLLSETAPGFPVLLPDFPQIHSSPSLPTAVPEDLL